MKSIADELALVQNPVPDEDLLIHILAQLGDEYNNITAALKVRDTPISFSELFDKLVDFERNLKDVTATSFPSIATVNNTQRQNNRFNNNRNMRGPQNSQQRFQGGGQENHHRFNNNNQPRFNRNSSYCQYCLIAGHDKKECRKLARFLKENNISINGNQTANSVINTTTSGTNSISPSWMFDSGASNHVTSDRSTLRNFSEYGGPDEIVLGDGSLHGGVSNAGGESS